MTVYFPYQYKFITILYPNKLHQRIRSDDNIDWKPTVDQSVDQNCWNKIYCQYKVFQNRYNIFIGNLLTEKMFKDTWSKYS